MVAPPAVRRLLPASLLVAALAACGSPTTPSQTVILSRRLAATKFLAFGDSMTAGEVPVPSDFSVFHLESLQPDKAYPLQLQAILQQRYVLQTIAVGNDGVEGETAVAGARRLPGELTKFAPDALLLLEGVNDLDGLGESGIQPALGALRSMIQTARARGVTVFVGTLLPQIAGLPRAGSVNLIVPFNAQLVAMATTEGAHVVDLYGDFVKDTADWISPLDGLHPTVAGYQEMARVFAAAIAGALETPPPTFAGASVGRP